MPTYDSEICILMFVKRVWQYENVRATTRVCDVHVPEWEGVVLRITT